jgi:hypothetical protein
MRAQPDSSGAYSAAGGVTGESDERSSDSLACEGPLNRWAGQHALAMAGEVGERARRPAQATSPADEHQEVRVGGAVRLAEKVRTGTELGVS